VTETRPDENLLGEARELILVSADATGAPQETPLPFVYDDGVVYLLAHSAADWYQNVQRDQGVVLRVERRGFRGRARPPNAKQRPQASAQITALFKRKYGAAVLKDWPLQAQRPVTIDIQF